MTDIHYSDSQHYALPKGLGLTRGVYQFTLAGKCLILICIASGFLIRYEHIWPVIVFAAFVEVFILFGIYKRMAWLVPLILVYSVIGLVSNLFSMLGEEHGIANIFSWDLSALFLISFCIYQLIFFTRVEMRMYFSEKSQFFI